MGSVLKRLIWRKEEEYGDEGRAFGRTELKMKKDELEKRDKGFRGD